MAEPQQSSGKTELMHPRPTPVLSERKQTLKIFLSRLLFACITLLLVELFRRGIYEYAIFTMFIFIFLLLPSLTELRICADQIVIKKYYCLATIVRSHNLNRQTNPRMSSFETEMEADTDMYLLSESFWSFLPIFLTPRTIIKYYAFKYTERGVTRKLTARLTNKEYNEIDAALTRIMYRQRPQ